MDVIRYLNYFLAVFFVQIGLGVIGPVLPDLKAHFDISMTAAGLVMATFGLARLIFDLPGGVIAQRFHSIKGTALGVILVSIGSLCSAFAGGYSMLVLGRFIAGIGSATVNVVVLTHLNRHSDYSNRGKILGLFQGFFLGGIGIGPAVGGMIGAAWGWRATFIFCALTALAALASVILTPLFQRPEGGRRKEGELPQKQAVSGIGTEGRAGGDTKAIITVNLVTFIMLFALEGFNNTIIPLYGSLVLGLPPDLLGVIITLGVFMRFLISMAGGILSDRLGRVTVLVPCMATAGVGIIAMYFAVNYWMFLLAVIIFAIGRMGNNLPLTLLGDLTPPAKIGWMTALNRFIADGGLALGPLVLGFIADRWGFTAAGIFSITMSWLITLVLWIVFRSRRTARSAV
ncbi:MAG: MFS transporter [Bacillota bacterium]